jgi:hypothetical protein
LHLFEKGGDGHYSMRCELDNAAPGPCVLRSPVVSGSKDLGFCCVELAASSDNVVFQLVVTSGDAALTSRSVTLQTVNNTFSGTACVAVPTASNIFYRVQLRAFSYMTSVTSAEQAEVLSFTLSSKDPQKVG